MTSPRAAAPRARPCQAGAPPTLSMPGSPERA